MKNYVNKKIRKAAIILGAGVLLALSPIANAQTTAASNDGVVDQGLSNGYDRIALNEIHNRNAVSVEPAVKPFSLIDLSRLKWSQSYSMSFGSNSFGSSGFGMYSGALTYEFSSKLSMQFAMGIAHNLTGGAINSGGELFPAFSLDYHPSDKFRLRIDVRKSPYSSRSRYGRQAYLSPYSSFGGYGGYGNGFGRAYGLGGY
ncbi:hypothetical protein JYU19_00085 [bacterium AH-315-J21]|nr:hypothetical protein [bacterium AH-315-J21]